MVSKTFSSEQNGRLRRKLITIQCPCYLSESPVPLLVLYRHCCRIMKGLWSSKTKWHHVLRQSPKCKNRARVFFKKAEEVLVWTEDRDCGNTRRTESMRQKGQMEKRYILGGRVIGNRYWKE